jgi:hypothetical protein
MVARKSASAVASATVKAVEAIDPIFEFQLEATPLDPKVLSTARLRSRS